MVKRYTVTVAPTAEDGISDETRPQMVVQIEIIDGKPHVVELTVRANAGADLASGPLPLVDLEHLARAFAPEGARGEPGGEPGVLESAAVGGSPVAVAAEQPSVPRPQSGTSSRQAARARSGPSAASAESRVARARAYRKMPEPSELQRVFSEVGSITGVAKHYDVPVHTAQGWIGRLRKRIAAVTD